MFGNNKGGLFGGHNPYQKRRLEQENLPDAIDIIFLKEVLTFTKKKEITTEVEKQILEIGEGYDEILEFNNNIDTKDDNDYRLITFNKFDFDLYSDAKNKIDEILSGGKSQYKKEKLKSILQTGHSGINIKEDSVTLFPDGFNWEDEYVLYYPEEYGKKLSPKGNWIMILDDYAIESAPKKYNIHYATRLNKTREIYGGVYKMWYASIIVNNKEVLMHPREYTIIEDANVLLDNIDKGIKMIEGSNSARLDKNKVFYLKSRGFSQAEIYQILFKSITNKGFCHFEVDEHHSNVFDKIKMGVKPELAIKIEKHLVNLPNFKFEKQC